MMENESIIERYAEKEKLNYRNLNVVQSNIVKTLWKHKKLPRDIICEETGISRTTVYDNIYFVNKGLIKRGILECKTENNGKRGRPIKYWFLTDEFKKTMELKLENGQT